MTSEDTAKIPQIHEQFENCNESIKFALTHKLLKELHIEHRKEMNPKASDHASGFRTHCHTRFAYANIMMGSWISESGTTSAVVKNPRYELAPTWTALTHCASLCFDSLCLTVL